MSEFKLPKDIFYNREMISDPAKYIKDAGGASWLYLNGEEFNSMPGGMSYSQVQSAISACVQVISDPPRELNLDLAKKQFEALESLPRPTLISCRKGPRASAVAYMYAAVKLNANYEDVIAAAEKEKAPFCDFPEYKEWVRLAIENLRR